MTLSSLSETELFDFSELFESLEISGGLMLGAVLLGLRFWLPAGVLVEVTLPARVLLPVGKVELCSWLDVGLNVVPAGALCTVGIAELVRVPDEVGGIGQHIQSPF
jgi:hypothetical protein